MDKLEITREQDREMTNAIINALKGNQFSAGAASEMIATWIDITHVYL